MIHMCRMHCNFNVNSFARVIFRIHLKAKTMYPTMFNRFKTRKNDFLCLVLLATSHTSMALFDMTNMMLVASQYCWNLLLSILQRVSSECGQIGKKRTTWRRLHCAGGGWGAVGGTVRPSVASRRVSRSELAATLVHICVFAWILNSTLCL